MASAAAAAVVGRVGVDVAVGGSREKPLVCGEASGWGGRRDADADAAGVGGGHVGRCREGWFGGDGEEDQGVWKKNAVINVFLSIIWP